MKATIYFKDSSEKSSVTVENLIVIKARNTDDHKKPKTYDNEEKFQVFRQ